MTPDKLRHALDVASRTAKGRQLIVFAAAFVDQVDRAGKNSPADSTDWAQWCLDVGGGDPCKIWSRAVAVLRLPDWFRDLVELN